MIKYLLMFIVIFYSNLGIAHNGNNGWVTIKNFQLWSNTYNGEEIRVTVNDSYYNPAGAVCSDPDSYMVSTSLPKEAQQRIYSTLLSAVLASKEVKLILDTTSCQGNKPKIITVVIQ